ncbi:reverse transcriptase domain-containing protein [Tanacetum coccineum]
MTLSRLFSTRDGVNPKIHEVIKAEVIKRLDAGLIYPIFDSPWVSPIHVIPKKGDGFSGYFQTLIDPQDQEKTTFTCHYGTFAYRMMPFGLCNATRTFQRCMVAIFHDMVEKTMEVFMDDFLVFGDSFSSYLSHLDMMLKCSANDPPVGKDTPFFFSPDCQSSFEILKKKLTEAHILVSRDWDLPFELMCDASDFAILLLQEFNIEIRDKKGAENLAADHLSRLENPQGDRVGMKINENFPHETLDMISLNPDNEPP